MKNLINRSVICLVLALLAPQIVEAQGTQYLSNLGYTSNGSSLVGSDLWWAAPFETGTNAGGYELNSVQLAMTDATGNPSGLTVMIYTDIGTDSVLPGSSLGSLSGSASPTTGGNYTYTAPLNLILSPHTFYHVVLTAGTAVANGAYNWSYTSTSSSGFNSYHWASGLPFLNLNESLTFPGWKMIDGEYGQFAINATAVPEPSTLGLLALGGLLLGWRWRKSSR